MRARRSSAEPSSHVEREKLRREMSTDDRLGLDMTSNVQECESLGICNRGNIVVAMCFTARAGSLSVTVFHVIDAGRRKSSSSVDKKTCIDFVCTSRGGSPFTKLNRDDRVSPKYTVLSHRVTVSRKTCSESIK